MDELRRHLIQRLANDTIKLLSRRLSERDEPAGRWCPYCQAFLRDRTYHPGINFWCPNCRGIVNTCNPTPHAC